MPETDAPAAKPSYLGLNAIAVGEARAHRYLNEWTAVTEDPGVKAVLQTVCWREGEDGMSFAKRIDQLGYSVRTNDDPDIDRDLAVAASTELSDREKLEHFQTGALLGRYVAEEFDSARLLAGCHSALCER